MLKAGVLGDVDAACLPAFRHIGERGRRLPLLL
jgi:hypothetical protein